MMSVLEYANDVNKSVGEILKMCEELNIKVTNETDLLTEEDIVILDNADFEAMDDIVEEIIETKNIKVEDSINKQKLKKKELYKNINKLMTNTTNDKVVLYK